MGPVQNAHHVDHVPVGKGEAVLSPSEQAHGLQPFGPQPRLLEQFPPRARLEARVNPAQKALFERAAALRGQSLTDFLVQSAQTAAEEIIRTNELIILTERDTAALVEALRNPPQPTEAMLEAYQLHRETVDQRW